MLELVEVSSFLTEQLNIVGSNSKPSYEFDIQAEVGKNEKGSVVYGILISNKPILPPVNQVKSAVYNLRVKLQVNSPLANFNLKNIEKIVSDFIETWNGKTYSFKNGIGTLTFTLTGTNGFKTESGQGNILPIEFDVNINYNENVVPSAERHWFLDNLEIPFLSESIIVEKNGKTSPINDRNYQQTFLTNQMKLYRFTFYYDVKNVLCSNLQKDILDGDANKTYELKYYDGVSFTSENPYITTVSILRNANTQSQKPDNTMFDITFADVDDGKNTTKYFIALIDNPFDAQTENVRYFLSRSEQQTYFAEKVQNGADYDEIKAPNLNSLSITNQIYVNSRNYDMFDLVNKNYAIIKVVKNDVEHFFYYKITGSNIGLNGQMLYDLQLDTFQTYFIDDKLKIDGSFIEKGHIDRWIDNGDETISFNGKANSQLFEREQIKEVAQRLISKQKLGLKKYTANYTENGITTAVDISKWLNENVSCWVYIFVDAQKYNVYKESVSSGTLPTTTFASTKSNQLDLYTTALCYPIYKSNNFIKLNGKNVIFDEIALDGFKNVNTGTSFIRTAKLSLKCPIPINKWIVKCKIVDNNLELITNTDYGNGAFGIQGSDRVVTTNIDEIYAQITTAVQTSTPYEEQQGALFVIREDNLTPFEYELSESLPLNFTFDKDSVKNGLKNKNYNPKMLSGDYKTLTLRIAGASQEFDIQKLNTSTPKFTYLETLTADTTRAIVRFISDNDEDIFNDAYSDSLNGLMVVNDLSLPLISNAYDEYFANNKNAYLSFQTQQQYLINRTGFNFAKTGVDTILNPVNMITNGVGIIEQGISAGMQLEYAKTQFELTLDNMKNAPDIIKNANGSPVFINGVEDYGIYLELYEGLNNELEIANDIMFRDGYTVNHFGDIKEYCNIRKNFNYVRAILGNISGIPISESARADLRQRFANGIRLWKSDDIDYSLENYEVKLDS